MGAVAMDQSENIALAYNATSSTVFPSLRYTGRKFDGPLGVMTETETDIHTGTASNSSIRYGDYAAMGVDPSDDCTFWFTGMDNTSSSWRTQAASFKFDACGCLLAPAVRGSLSGRLGVAMQTGEGKAGDSDGAKGADDADAEREPALSFGHFVYP